MKQAYSLNINEVKDFLLNVATIRPVFIWGAPGIGKSSVVEQFSRELGYECVTLLGSQLAPEDLIGIPQIVEKSANQKVSKFIPPAMLVRDEPFVLFLDELNLASQEVRKAFYSLILDKRVGDLVLPEGTIVIGAGNRASDSALVSQMNSALISRMVHITMKVSSSVWLDWARKNNLNEVVLDFISQNPTFLSTEIPPADEACFSTPRTWHTVADILNSYINSEKKLPDGNLLKVILQGNLSENHRTVFEGFVKLQREKYKIYDILEGKANWPTEVDKRDILLYLVQSLRQILQKELPKSANDITGKKSEWVHKVRKCINQLGTVNKELCTQLIVKDENGESLPNWFVTELSKDNNMLDSLVEVN